MILTVMILLVVSAFITCIISMMGRCPLWVPVLLLCVIALVNVIPLK